MKIDNKLSKSKRYRSKTIIKLGNEKIHDRKTSSNGDSIKLSKQQKRDLKRNLSHRNKLPCEQITKKKSKSSVYKRDVSYPEPFPLRVDR